jgi:quercetin dioxygenase-like cupin family protein
MSKRIITPNGQYRLEEISPGVSVQSLYPGGKNGPNSELLLDTPGGQGWSEAIYLGDQRDAFQMLVPDIRLPANQYWPLHWHDCWTAVLVLEGSCLVGDWWMKPDDLFLTEPSLEYGPLVIGPRGCRLFEIFAQAHLSPGGYSPEYRDHPTLQGTSAVFKQCSPINERNRGRQTLPCDGVEGITKTMMKSGGQWNLGAASDPDRGVMRDTRLEPGQRVAAHQYGDWHALIVLSGSLNLSGRTLAVDNLLLIQPRRTVADLIAGPEGTRLLELARTSRGLDALDAG